MNYTAMVIMGLALFVGLIFLGREITRWYFRIYQIEALLTKNNELLEKILKKGETESTEQKGLFENSK